MIIPVLSGKKREMEDIPVGVEVKSVILQKNLLDGSQEVNSQHVTTTEEYGETCLVLMETNFDLVNGKLVGSYSLRVLDLEEDFPILVDSMYGELKNLEYKNGNINLSINQVLQNSIVK